MLTKEFVEGISFEIAKQKYYNANKVNAVFDELKSGAVELIDENAALKAELEALKKQLDEIEESREKVGDIMLNAEKSAEKIVSDAKTEAIKIIADAKNEANLTRLEGSTSEGGTGLSEKQMNAVVAINKQLEDLNIMQATQLFKIKRAIMDMAMDK